MCGLVVALVWNVCVEGGGAESSFKNSSDCRGSKVSLCLGGRNGGCGRGSVRSSEQRRWRGIDFTIVACVSQLFAILAEC